MSTVPNMAPLLLSSSLVLLTPLLGSDTTAVEVVAGIVVVVDIEGWGPAPQTGDTTAVVAAVAALLDNTPVAADAVKAVDLHSTSGAGQD